MNERDKNFKKKLAGKTRSPKIFGQVVSISTRFCNLVKFFCEPTFVEIWVLEDNTGIMTTGGAWVLVQADKLEKLSGYFYTTLQVHKPRKVLCV